MDTLKFEMTVDQTNLVLEALGSMPYIKVHRLIAQIQAQAQQQMQAAQASETVMQALAGGTGPEAGQLRAVDQTEQVG